MKKYLGNIATGLTLCLLILFSSCMKMQNESDGDWIRVNLDVRKSVNTNDGASKSVVNSDGNFTYPSVLITAVKGTLDSVSITTDLSDNYGQMLLRSDGTVSFTLPVGDSVRLVRAHFQDEPTLVEVLSGSLSPMSIGISEPFTLDANTSRKSVQVVMPTITYNLSKDSYVKGVYKTSATGTQAFDENYWGWHDSGYLGDTDYDLNLYADQSYFYFLENNNKTISFMKSIQHPLFPYYAGDSYGESLMPFADGSYAGKMTSTGSSLPIRATAGTTKAVDLNGNLATDVDDTWDRSVIEYNSTTGYPTTATYTNMDSTTGDPFTGVVTEECGGISIDGYNSTRTFSQRTGSDFTSITYNGYTAKDVNGNTQCVYKQTWEGTNTGTGLNFTETKETYGSDGTTLVAWMNPLEEQANAAKWVRTFVLSGNVATNTKKWYDVSGNEFFRTVITDTLSNVPLRHRSASSSKGYDVSAGVATLAYQDDYTYINNFQVGETSYTVSGGTASVSQTKTFTRDAQGRMTGGVIKDSNGIITASRAETFDANGKRTGSREFTYPGGVKTAACTDNFVSFGLNWDQSYSTIGSGTLVYTGIGYCDWSSGTPGTYRETPYYKNVRTYNAMGLQIERAQYSDPGATGNFTLDTLQSWAYDSNGAMTEEQNYSVSGGVATASYNKIYEYDANLFRTAVKVYDEDGDLSTCFDADTCTTNKASYKCSAGSHCYYKSTWTYY